METGEGEGKLIHAAMTRRILGCAIDVHRDLGPGLLESAYRSCLVARMKEEGLVVRQEVPVAINYRGHIVEGGYRADLIVDDAVVVELKAMDALLPIHGAQIRTYLKFLDLHVGLLMNFNVVHMMSGVRRFVRSAPILAADPTLAITP
jgi:GxxExxY protein